ncbi:kinetochore protein spc25 [Penicillium cosmopolitanum]|uniref:Kinetochore protein SPC25 n=1 Tax=Penicillium cosmopolitanum TaxID=1131564 RepID=A0A9W9SLS6_9EURO|nr:kinetochore protein spc25 [Penicillium cosmopolitanum]KAJ5379609.1 kinetochore protein spc25 [Penicillium cosmopolitanum]
MVHSTSDSSRAKSGMRPPLASANAPSMADSLPRINSEFEDLRNRMAQFTTKFDAAIERRRKQVREDRDQFHVKLTELQEDERMIQRDIEIINLKSQSHEETIQNEAAEATEMHAAVSSITSERDSRLAKRDHLKQKIAEIRNSIAQRVEAQNAHAKYLEVQSRLNDPELAFWQNNLSLRIEGAGREDRLKFIYTHISEKDWENEAWFELGIASRNYEIFQTEPKLDRDALEREVNLVNENRNLGAFLKRVRTLFADTMN